MEDTTESEKHVFECVKGTGFVSEAVKIDAFGESGEEIDTHEEFLDGSEGSREVKQGTIEEENFVSETTEVELAKEDEEEFGVLECEKEDEKDCLMGGLSDDDWEVIERTELEKDFGKAVWILECKSNADEDFKIGNDLKMQLYGLHKIATEWPCYEPQPMALKLSARANWNAWKILGSMSPELAMELYMILVSSSIHGFVQDDICDSADAKANRKLPFDVKTMSVNQAVDVDHRSIWNISFLSRRARSTDKKICPSVMEITLVGIYAETSPKHLSARLGQTGAPTSLNRGLFEFKWSLKFSFFCLAYFQV